MDFLRFMSLYKIMCAMNNPMIRNQITNNEFDLACEALKNIADNTYTWTREDKERYRALVDFVKDAAKSKNYQV